MSYYKIPTDSKGRKLLNIGIKKKIIELAVSGVKQKEIATTFGLGRSTVTKILLNKDNVMKSSLEDLNDPRFRIRKDEFYLLELKLFKWGVDFSVIESQGKNLLETPYPSTIPCYKFKDNILKGDIISKSKELSNEMGLSNFEPTDKWFGKFKRKFNIRFRRCSRKKPIESNSDKGQADNSSVDVTDLDINEGLSIGFNSNYSLNLTLKSNVPIEYRNFSNISNHTNNYIDMNSTFNMMDMNYNSFVYNPCFNYQDINHISSNIILPGWYNAFGSDYNKLDPQTSYVFNHYNPSYSSLHTLNPTITNFNGNFNNNYLDFNIPTFL